MKSVKSAIIGIGSTGCGKFSKSPAFLMAQAFGAAVRDAGKDIFNEIDGLVIVPPTIGDPQLTADFFASQIDIREQVKFLPNVSTMGAGPVSAVLLADQLIKARIASVVAVVAGDSFTSFGAEEMLFRMGKSINYPDCQDFSQPVVPLLYDRATQWYAEKYSIRREHFSMVPVLMSIQGNKHPLAMNRKILSLEDVLHSRPIGKMTNMFECARPGDGAGALIIASSDWAHNYNQIPVYILGGDERRRERFLPTDISKISENMFPARAAMMGAFKSAHVALTDIGWFGLYDCFPICFLRAIEEVGLASQGEGGDWVAEKYRQYLLNPTDPNVFPVNTHGGLLSYGAPWAAPAIFSVIEAVEQLRGTAGRRQIANSNPAFIYANGGIFHYAAAAVLGLSD